MCAIWGTTWLAIKIGIAYLPPMTGVGIRFTIAALVLFAAAFARREVLPLRDLPWKLVVVLAVCLFGLNYVLTYVAEIGLSSGLTAVLYATLPFFTFFMGHYMIGELTTPRIWFGAALGFVGVGVISLAGATHGSLPYAAAIIGASALSGYASVFTRFYPRFRPLAVLPPSMLLGAIPILALGLAFEHPSLHGALMPASIAAVLYLALLGSCVTFFIFLWLLQRIPVWTANLASLVIPVIAVTVGIVFAHETFGWRDFAGAALVIVGMWIALTSRQKASAS
jgi:drug/metabolite transporter (DMT)-like permease